MGIGLATAVFTVADALLVRQLPVRDQERLVLLWGERRDGSFAHYPLGLDNGREFAQRTRSLERVAFVAYEGASPTPVREGDQSGAVSRVRRSLVSGAFFDVIGARPVLGRALRAEDDVSGAAPVLVLSYAGWRLRFAGDLHVIGRQVLMYGDGVAYTIVGVMPRGLDYPRGTEMWVPVVSSTPPQELSLRAFDAIGRLARGATPIEARDELTLFFARPQASGWQRDLRGTVRTLPRLILGDTRPALFVFAAAVGLLLLITCINVANLLLVRGLARVPEIATRKALGASRWQVMVQLMTENALLAMCGGVLGLAVAAGAVRSFQAFAPAELPRLDEIQLNATVLAGAVVITGIAMLIFGLAPALVTSRVELQRVLRSDARQSATHRSRLVVEGLVVAQIALALLVLSATGLIARSLVKLERAELSIETSHLLIGELALRSDQFDDPAKQLALLEKLVPQVKAIPGVRAVSPVVAGPFSGPGGWDGGLAAEGQPLEKGVANRMLNMEVVSPGYFATFGIPVLRGRGFTDQDRVGAPAVVVISQSAARHYWGGDDPIGRRLLFGGKAERTLIVVGVVPDTRYRDLRIARSSVYFPLRQSFFPFVPMTLAIRTAGPPTELVPAIRRVISETGTGVALASAASFETFLEGPLAQPRLNAFLLAVFATAAVALAAIGLFAVMAMMVRQRTRELGVRMALGATASEIGQLVLQRGMALAAAGTLVGVLGALGANHLLTAMLFEVSATDAPTLGLVAMVLLGVAALASFIPARSSTRIDPVVALRAD